MNGPRVVESPIGRIRLEATSRGLTGLRFVDGETPAPAAAEPGCDDAARSVLDLAERELLAYFVGALTRFTVPVAPEGTAFQQRVWRALQTIRFGETRSYIELARQLDLPGGSRAVGGANGANPIPIVIPCHRVVAADGSLGGFSAGLDRKQWLLAHEGACGDEGLLTRCIEPVAIGLERCAVGHDLLLLPLDVLHRQHGDPSVVNLRGVAVGTAGVRGRKRELECEGGS
jgi:methylated-DNA-[protein]-cysteine S-methyltransferase